MVNNANGTASAVITSDPPAAERLHFIDGLRALAALFVVVGHMYFEPAAGFYRERWMHHLLLTYSYTAVDVFIVISGYCLMLPVAKRKGELGSVFKFFRNRALRILPPYYAALVLCSIFIILLASKTTGTVWDCCLPLSVRGFFVRAFLLQDIPFVAGHTGLINYVFWSIAAEWQIYFLMPLIVISLRRFSEVIVAGMALAAGFAIHIASKGYFDIACPWYIGLFVFGCISARWSIAAPSQFVPKLRMICSIMLIGVFAAIVLKGHAFFQKYLPEIDTIIGAATAIGLYCLYSDRLTQKQIITRVLSYAPLVAVGEFSYSLYLVHPAIIHLLDMTLRRLFHLSPVSMFFALLLCLPIVVAAAYGFHLLFEKPFMRRKSPGGLASAAPVPAVAIVLQD